MSSSHPCHWSFHRDCLTFFAWPPDQEPIRFKQCWQHDSHFTHSNCPVIKHTTAISIVKHCNGPSRDSDKTKNQKFQPASGTVSRTHNPCFWCSAFTFNQGCWLCLSGQPSVLITSAQHQAVKHPCLGLELELDGSSNLGNHCKLSLAILVAIRIAILQLPISKVIFEPFL